MRNKRRTREEILAYHREYNKKYKLLKKGSLVDKELMGLIPENCFTKALPINEITLEIEERTCEYNGCGKTLSRTEKLFGNHCTKHNGINFKKTLFNNGKL